MNRSTLIIGGAKSGKSSYALTLGTNIIMQGSYGKGLFLATATASDAEMKDRIKRHQKERGDHWETIEEPLKIKEVIKQNQRGFDVILVDCLTLWLTNMMLNAVDTEKATLEIKKTVPGLTTPIIFVSNEVGMGIVPADPLARKFRDMAGRMNQEIASVCRGVYFMAAGIPLCMKGDLNRDNKHGL